MKVDKQTPGIGKYMKKLNQKDHERINAVHYPGTRQLCCVCDLPTGRCEEDEICIGDIGPLCEDCYAIFPEEMKS